MVADSPVTLRLMADDDLPMFHRWLQRPHVVKWWGDDDQRLSLREARAKYSPRIVSSERVTPYIAMLDGRSIGYAQSYVALGCGGGWWEDETDPGVRGIDQFLSEENMLGQGVGTRLATALVDMLFRDPQVTRIQTDPDPTNVRAIRCYEKAGFKAVRSIVTPNGPALYMVREKNSDERQ